MDSGSRFRSTVLQRPGGDDEHHHDDHHRGDRDRDRDGAAGRHHRDILNPAQPPPPPPPPSSVVAPPPGAVGAPPGPPPAHSAFSLRSPTQAEFHHRPPPYGPPSASAAVAPPLGAPTHHAPPSHHSPPRPALSSFMASGPGHHGSGNDRGAPPLSPMRGSGYYPHARDEPPPREKQGGGGGGGSFYDPLTDTTTKERRTSDTGSWHGPAQVSPPKREPYGYGPSPSVDQQQQHSSYYNGSVSNGNYASPKTSTFQPRSPASHSHRAPASASPSSRPVVTNSPGLARPLSPPSLRPTSNGGVPSIGLSNLLAPHSPSPAAPKTASTPSRAAELMSFSNILSSAEPPSRSKSPPPPGAESREERQVERRLSPKPSPAVIREPSPDHRRQLAAPIEEPSKKVSAAPATAVDPARENARREESRDREVVADSDDTSHIKVEMDTEPEVERPVREKRKVSSSRPNKERKDKVARKSKGRVSDIKDNESGSKSAARRSLSGKESPTTPRIPAKRQANGQTKSAQTIQERRIQVEMDAIDENLLTEEDDEALFNDEDDEYVLMSRKRQRLTKGTDCDQNLNRYNVFVTKMVGPLRPHLDSAKGRYDSIYYDDAFQEVKNREVFAEKERKKDMQRKRRREKSMATALEQKEAAEAKANLAGNEEERQKHLREAERASKKAQQTKLVLQKGIKGPVRSLELNLEGGTMSTFNASDMEPGKKGKGRSGPRPKKSKEQKQAEKQSAEAAQAAIDAGEELPPPKEGESSGKIRLKVGKKGKNAKVKEEAHDDGDKDKENREPKLDKEAKLKEKAAPDEPPPDMRFQSKGYNQIYDQIWRDLARKDVNKTNKLATESYITKASNLKKTSILASKEAKRWQLKTNKGTKDQQARAKRVMRDMMSFWKRNEREERDLRKAAEKQELENQRKEEADREAARQKRKLNFLISQTELYSHFIGKKIKTSEVERSTDNPEVVAAAADKDKIPEHELDVAEPTGPIAGKVTNFENLDFDNDDETQLQQAAIANAQNAIAEAQKKARQFNNEEDTGMDEDGEMNFQNPTGLGKVEIEQPKLINAQLKEYQLKGLNWLVNLYEQGINGILADEMGLGKTIQSISVMAYLAEKYDVWGPFLVVAPASTLHNWEQEIRKFVPEFKILPYWGNAADRKVLRKFWDRKHSIYKKEASFHVCITSYQLVVSDVAYFQKMRWQYMILDEAQAIKSSQSSRWKSLLSFHCRNRLLLTGTPIQNNMQELWALLHFIMPSLFDSHDEFSEWFSKDIESHAQSNTKLNEDQLKRLHMILKPFMLRRVKKHVQKELGDKIELDVFCNLTYRQRAYYSNLRNQISIMDLIEKATMSDDDSSTLMNLVMQFRKVCNHPDLFERAETSSPFSFGYFAETASFVREGNSVQVKYSTRSHMEYRLPGLIWCRDGRLDKAGPENERAGWRHKALAEMMNIFTPNNVAESMASDGAFSFLRFADTSPGDVYAATHTGIVQRAQLESTKSADRLAQFKVAYDDADDEESFTPGHALFLVAKRNNRKPLADITKEGVLGKLMNVAWDNYADSGMSRLEQGAAPGATAPPIEVMCAGRGAHAEREDTFFNRSIRRVLFGVHPAEVKALAKQKIPPAFYPRPRMLPQPDSEKKRFNNITVPSMRRFVTDSGKLAKLDELLFRLKNENHRVLLYFQMTRMIDLMEEYLTYRNFKYCRLDGSTKLEDRRDTVHDFQTRPEIFIFLLSTRAGGLGINLTSADTVIFYDSDWNPTIDSQAMDRAHRLGQTRQVTVYRLITRNTIEERIRKRALQKEEVQRVVIQGGGASVDFSGRRPPENRNRDIAMWLADDEQAELIERRERELLESGELEKTKKKGKKSKKAAAASGGGAAAANAGGDGGAGVSLDDMYHEGEGHFDDGNKPSGTATPVATDTSGKVAKKRKMGSKKAKTTKQRLAIADGMVD